MTNLELLFARIESLATYIGNSVQLRGFKLGGTAGQVPTKINGTDFNWSWQSPSAGTTNLTFSRTATTVTVVSDTGTDAVLPVATVTDAGVLSAADKVKLDATSGTNTGDQNLSGYLTIASATTTYQPLDSDLTSWAGVVRGTGFDTAAAINVGSAGAFVTFNGAGGTPSSLTLTNATGLPVGSITGLGTGVQGGLVNSPGGANGFVLFSGAMGTPTSITLTSAIGLPLTTGVTGVLPVANGGTGVSTSGTTAQIAVGGGTGSAIVWTTATGTGAPVRATSPTLVTPVIGAATGTSLNTSGQQIVTGGTTKIGMDADGIIGGFGTLYILPVATAPSSSNYAFTSNGSTIKFNAPSGAADIQMCLGNGSTLFRINSTNATVSHGTASTTSTSGALVVTGGLGVSGDINVGAPGTNTTSVVTNASGDARYKRKYVLRLTSDVSCNIGNTYVNGGETLSLPAGTYKFDWSLVGATASITGGVTLNIAPSLTNADVTTAVGLNGITTGGGAGNTPSIYNRSGSNLFQFLITATNSGFVATHLNVNSTGSGTVVFSSAVVLTPQVKQPSATDAVNPALLKAGSYLSFELL